MEINKDNPKLVKFAKYRYKHLLLSKLYEDNGTYVDGAHKKLLIEESSWFIKNAGKFTNFTNSFNFNNPKEYFKRYWSNIYLALVGPIMILLLNGYLFIKYYFLQHKYINENLENYKSTIINLKVTPFAYFFGAFTNPFKYYLSFIISYNIERLAISLIYSGFIIFMSINLAIIQTILLPIEIIFSIIAFILGNMKKNFTNNKIKEDKYIIITE